MQLVENKEFNNYIEAYKKLSSVDKRKVVEAELKEIVMVLQQLNANCHNDVDILFNREILDLNKDDMTEDDFTEAIFVYLNAIKELLAHYVTK